MMREVPKPMVDHRINDVTQMGDEGRDGVLTHLEQAHAILALISSTIGEREGFHALNDALQYRIIESAKTHCALAHYHAANLQA